jgi:hypothetical protein
MAVRLCTSTSRGLASTTTTLSSLVFRSENSFCVFVQQQKHFVLRNQDPNCMILEPFNAAVHTFQDLRRAADAPVLVRTQRAAKQLGEHAVHVVGILEAIEHAHHDARVSADVAERIERMDTSILALTSLLQVLRNGPALKALIWRDEVASRIRVAYTTLEDAIDKLDVRVLALVHPVHPPPPTYLAVSFPSYSRQ